MAQRVNEYSSPLEKPFSTNKSKSKNAFYTLKGKGERPDKTGRRNSWFQLA